MNKIGYKFLFFALLIWLVSGPVLSEPYLAVRSGLKCMVCHTNPTGGGQRTIYGNTYGQTDLAARRLVSGEDDAYWDGVINKWISVGGDLRTGLYGEEIDNQDDELEFDLQEALVYINVSLIPEYLSLYIDQQIASGSTNREAFLRLNFADGKGYFRAGQFFLPFGWRLQDDEAFIRQVTGINYNTPDEGIEVGYEAGNWSSQIAITNGTGGGGEVDTGKQFSFRTSYVTSKWRLGGSFNFNDADAGDRRMQGVFFGLRTGLVSWLVEGDYIVDKGTPTGRRELWASFVEGNWLIRKGHNLKVTYEHLDPDDDVDENEINRYSVLWEYTPIQFTQLRTGVRNFDGIPQNDLQNRTEYFIELHGYF